MTRGGAAPRPGEFGGFTSITSRSLNRLAAAQPPADDVGSPPAIATEDVAALHLLVQAIVYRALAEGPPETVAERIDWSQLQRLSRAVVAHINDAEERVVTVEKRVTTAVTQYNEMVSRRLRDITTAAIGNGFEPHGYFVYLLFGEDGTQPIYVGMSSNVLARLGQHMINEDRRHRITRVALIRCADRGAALVTESDLIGKYQPELNQRGIRD